MTLRISMSGERVGQAFMNALSCAGDSGQYAAIPQSPADPYYMDSYKSVWDAIDYITRGAVVQD